MKQMSSTPVQEYKENKGRQLLSRLPAIVFSDFKRRSRLSLFCDYVLGKKQWAQKIEKRKPKFQKLLNLLNQRIRKPGSSGGSHCNHSTNRPMRVLSKFQRKTLRKKRALKIKAHNSKRGHTHFRQRKTINVLCCLSEY